MLWEQEDRESTGSSPSPEMTGRPVYRRESIGSEDNLNGAQPRDTSTGSVWWPSPRRNLWPESNQSLENPCTPNSRDQRVPTTTFGRKTPESKVPNLNTGNDPSSETAQRIGTPSGDLQLLEISVPFRQKYVFVITGHCDQLQRTLQNQLVWSELALYSSVQLEQENHDLLGNRLGWKLTVRIPTQSFGAVTVAKNVLSSMNFVVASMYHTYYDGLIVIHATWKLKDHLSHYVQNPFGSHPTWTWNNGTQN